MLAVFGIIVVLPLLANLYATRGDYKRYVDALMLSSMICMFWAFTNAIGALWAFPDSKKFHGLVDLIGLITCVVAYLTQRFRWKAVLAGLFMAQLVAHAVFWWVYDGATSGSIAYNYKLTLNLTWLAQIACVAYPGAGVVLRDTIHWMRGRGRLGSLVGLSE